VAQQHPTGSETTPPYAPRSSRFGSEPPSVEDDVDAIVSCMPETTTTVVKIPGVKNKNIIITTIIIVRHMLRQLFRDVGWSRS